MEKNGVVQLKLNKMRQNSSNCNVSEINYSDVNYNSGYNCFTNFIPPVSFVKLA